MGLGMGLGIGSLTLMLTLTLTPTLSLSLTLTLSLILTRHLRACSPLRGGRARRRQLGHRGVSFPHARRLTVLVRLLG